MLQIPYERQADPKACALACYTMVARHFFPEFTFDEIAKISRWEQGYVVWPFKFWLWMMDKGIMVEDYELINYEAWAKNGSAGLRVSVSEKEFDYYSSNTKDLESYSDDISRVLRHPNFRHNRQKPTMDTLIESVKAGSVCEVVMNSESGRGFSLHRVVVLEANQDSVIFHDPSVHSGPERKMSAGQFAKAWLEDLSSPELCIYRKEIR